MKFVIRSFQYFFLAVILCNFEEDFCDWTNILNKPEWTFERKTAEELSAESRPGPTEGLNGVKNDHFLILFFFLTPMMQLM